MQLVPNPLIPLPGFLALTVWPFVFIRRDLADRYTPTVARHESIHGRQQLEMLWLPFFLWYLVEWLIRLVLLRDPHLAYLSISFEQEAYDHQHDDTYLQTRRPFAWLRYLFK